MSYTISRHVSVLTIKTEKVTPQMRTQDFNRGDSTRESYSVRVAYFSDGTSGTTAQVEEYLFPNSDVSVAINNFKQIIAVKNHSSGKSGRIFEKMSSKIKDIITSLLYIVPILAFGFWLSSQSIPYFEAGRDEGWILVLIGGGALFLGFFLLKGVIGIDMENKKAFRELNKI